tara:strand:+ start:266 stop:577 length:312 start_codon:yes stop_codon:yes gene_type:complete
MRLGIYKNKQTQDFIKCIISDDLSDDYVYAMELVDESKNQDELIKKLKQWTCDISDDAINSYEYNHPFIIDIIRSSVLEIDYIAVAEKLISCSKRDKNKYGGK